MRKKMLFSALALTAALVASVCGGAVAASAATSLTPTETKTLGGEITYNYYDTTYATGRQKIFTASVNTSAADSKYEVVVHAVPGNGGFTPSYVKEIAEHYERTTGRKVYAGINGDFFAYSGSVVKPQQAYVQDGVVLSQGPNYGTGETKRSFGFDNKGYSVMGQLPTANLDIVTVQGRSGDPIEVATELNPSTLPAGEIAIVTTVGRKTFTGAKGYVVTVTEGKLGSDRTGVVGTKKTTGGGASTFDIGSGEFAIVVSDTNEQADWFATKFKIGATVTFEGKTAPAGVFKGMTQVVGGWADLVNAGTVISQSTLNTYVTTSGRGLTEYADRTFFGMKADGTLMLVAVDGRGSNSSKGLTVMEEARLAGDLGLYNAIELDGGGSTTMVIRENDQIVQKNLPSDGGKRKVCDAVLIVEKEESAHEHSFGDWQKDATQHWKECECGEEQGRANHNYTDDSDTTCDTCGYVRTVTPPAHEHAFGDWQSDETQHWKECSCGEEEGRADHDYTDDADTTCNTCGYVRTVTPPAHEHAFGDWQSDETQHWKECECGEEEGRADHVYTDDSDTTCDTCGYVRTVTPTEPDEPDPQPGGTTDPQPGGTTDPEQPGGTDPQPSEPQPNEPQPNTSEEKSGGCGGLLAAGGAAALALVAALGTAITFGKRKGGK